MKAILFYFDNRASKMFVETKNEEGESVMTLSSSYNFVARNEILARIVDIASPEDAKRHLDAGHSYYHVVPYFQFKTGGGVFFDDATKSYRASHYGFVVLDKTKALRLVVPFQVAKDKTKAWYSIHPTKSGKLPTYGDIEDILKLNKIVTPVDQKVIEADLAAIDPHGKHVSKIKVAQSREPINGRPEYFVPLISIDKKAGKLMEDGRIDFKEVDSIIQVKKGDEILRRYEEIKPQDGYDIYGEKAAAVIEESKGYQRGENLVQSGANPELFVSAIDGCLEVEKKKISVRAQVNIRGDVDYDSGNIDFQGSVHITGSVKPGFSVKVSGDIIVDQSVDDAYLEAGGSVTVKMGISGKGATIVKAEGDVRAKFILNSHVEARGIVSVEDSIINSKVFSNNRVLVTSQHGKIMGGEVLGLYRIEANAVGSAKETTTTLTVGRNLELERELEKIRADINARKVNLEEVMNKIKNTFGNHLFEDPKKYIEVLPAPKKKICLEMLAEVSNINKRIKELAVIGMQVEHKLVLEEDPQIMVKDTVYPGTTLMIKKRTRKIEEKLTNVKFYEDPEEKVIRYTAAV